MSLVPRGDFLGLDRYAYLATGQAGATLRAQLNGFTRYLNDRQRGIGAKRFYDQVAEENRHMIADLVHCASSDVGFVSSVAEAVNLVAGALPVTTRGSIVLERTEHPSAALPWLRQRHRGYDIRWVAPKPGPQRWDHILDAVDSYTRVVCVSHVSYYDGRRANVMALGDIARRRGFRLIVDASQSLGLLPVIGSAADVVVSCGHKWLLGPHGLGVIIWNRNSWPDIEPPSLGWHSVDHLPLELDDSYGVRATARRFEAGCPAYSSLYGLWEALRYLSSMGVDDIAVHSSDLGDRLIAGLEKLGLEVITPRKRSERGGSVCVSIGDPEYVQQALELAGVQVTGSHGRVRLCAHVYNEEAEVDRALRQLRKLLSG